MKTITNSNDCKTDNNAMASIQDPKGKQNTASLAKILEKEFNINTEPDDDIDWKKDIENQYNTIINQNNNKIIKQTDNK